MKKLADYYYRKNKLAEHFIENHQFLYPGNYRFDESLTYIHLDDKKISKKSAELFSQGLPVLNFVNGRSYMKTMLTKAISFYLNKKLVIDHKTKSNFKGKVYLPGGNGNDVKIFDFDNKEILIAFSDKGTFERKVAFYKQFSPHFPVPPIIDIIEAKQMIIERYTDYKGSTFWDTYDFNFVVNEIFRRYLEYFKKVVAYGDFKRVAPEELLEELPVKNQFLEDISNGISYELMKTPLITVNIHGDLWSSNILIDKEESNKVFFIDWELAGELYIFYDFFGFMWNEAINNKRYSFIRNYMGGDYDDYFSHAFELFGMEFEEEKKGEYLNVFFLNMYLRRWTKTDPQYLEWLHNEYLKFMEYVVSLDALPDMPRRL
ncbi:aminoglycoside phosphotransferase family protein [Metaplanococcus flavidus]